MVEKWTEHRVFEQLRHVWPSPAHVRLPQVRNGTGYARRKTRTADAVIASTWPSRGLWLAGVEIKVSRSDWKGELANPDKAAAIGDYCPFWYIAAPAGIVPVAEVPETWGLVEVTARSATIVKQAPRREHQQPDILLVCSILRAAEAAMVPAAAVSDQVQQQMAEIRDSLTRQAEREATELRDRIQRFEQNSGVHIDRWEFGQVARAVKIIQEAGSPYNALKQLRGQSEIVIQFAERLNELIAELPTEGADA